MSIIQNFKATPFSIIGFLVSAASLGLTYFFSTSHEGNTIIFRSEVEQFVVNKPYLFTIVLLAGIAIGSLGSYIEASKSGILENSQTNKLDWLFNLGYILIVLAAIGLLVVHTQIMWLVCWLALSICFIIVPAFISGSKQKSSITIARAENQ